MRAVDWKDEHGRRRRSLVKDKDSDSAAPKGLPIEPPDIYNGIDWNAVKDEIANMLYEQQLYTWQDVMNNQQAFGAAQSVIKRHLVNLYKAQKA